MAIDIPVTAPVRLTTTASTDVYSAPATPASVRATGLRFGIMHDGTSTNPVSVAVHVVAATGTYGNDTEVARISVSPGTSEPTRSMRLGPGGKIVMAAGEADQVTVNHEDGVVFS